MPARLVAAAGGVALTDEGRTLSVRDRGSGGLGSIEDERRRRLARG